MDNLGWKLAAVLAGRAGEGLLESYGRERGAAADENICQASRTSRFMTPRAGAERLFRDAVLGLAGRAGFARGMVNGGRLSVPCVYPSAGADDARLPAAARPGAVAPDAPLGTGWLLEKLGGGLKLLAIGGTAQQGTGLEVVEAEATETLVRRYLGEAAQAVYLVRPDQVVAARWVEAGPEAVAAAVEAVLEGRA